MSLKYYLNYNKRTFEKFMQDIKREYRERISVNKKLLCENEDLKMQVLEAEKELASMMSDSTHSLGHFFSCVSAK